VIDHSSNSSLSRGLLQVVGHQARAGTTGGPQARRRAVAATGAADRHPGRAKGLSEQTNSSGSLARPGPGHPLRWPAGRAGRDSAPQGLQAADASLQPTRLPRSKPGAGTPEKLTLAATVRWGKGRSAAAPGRSARRNGRSIAPPHRTRAALRAIRPLAGRFQARQGSAANWLLARPPKPQPPQPRSAAKGESAGEATQGASSKPQPPRWKGPWRSGALSATV